jgi:hypothetical protein
MCDHQGFDPNSADYDCRTAPWWQQWNTDTVTTISEYQANLLLIDVRTGLCII